MENSDFFCPSNATYLPLNLKLDIDDQMIQQVEDHLKRLAYLRHLDSLGDYNTDDQEDLSSSSDIEHLLHNDTMTHSTSTTQLPITEEVHHHSLPILTKIKNHHQPISANSHPMHYLVSSHVHVDVVSPEMVPVHSTSVMQPPAIKSNHDQTGNTVSSISIQHPLVSVRTGQPTIDAPLPHNTSQQNSLTFVVCNPEQEISRKKRSRGLKELVPYSTLNHSKKKKVDTNNQQLFQNFKLL